MEPIRVLQVLTIMNRGGAETMVMNYYRNIDRSKVQFDFLLHRQEKGAFDEEIKKLGGKIHRLQNINFKNLSKYKSALDNFFKHHKEYKIVHSHLNALSVFVLKSAKKNNINIRIAHSHTSLYNLNLNPFSKERHSFGFAFKFVVQNILKQNITKYANHYFSCGDKAGAWLYGKKNKSKIKIINNAIDSSNFIYDPEKSLKIRSELNVGNKMVIGHVGNFVPEKNHQFILQTFQQLKKIKEDCVLLLVGGGPKKSTFELMAKEMGIDQDILFLGVRNDVPILLQGMDAFIFPSTNEGLPVTLIEAQASGLGIVASDEISKELNITGLVDFMSLEESPQLWAKKILSMLGENKQNTMKKIIDCNYDIKNNTLLLQEFYVNQINK
ncbi:glycosyltransferase family 1 protein [Aquimarina sp. I32.4]|uniref:glycosyltransferase family 1 protein n=1 Tax=Aquimarina sp. I32.4 TaxID=2053903 RepID=UPI000CDE83DA|nr:glycosyltransferase family 1 protein [Aquimarina sp. I32.4]